MRRYRFLAVGLLVSFLAASPRGFARAVQKQLRADRRALRSVPGEDGKPAFFARDVTALIHRTKVDLDQALETAQPTGTQPLRAWAAVEIERIEKALPAPSGPTVSIHDPATPRGTAGVMLASTKPRKPAPPSPAAPKPAMIPAAKASPCLEELAKVVERIFVLASHDDLEVTLWVGSTPAPKATFRFWPEGSFEGSPPPPLAVQTNAKRDRVLRGLYRYRASWGQGAVTQVIQYPAAGSPGSGLESERLDLVKGSSFFCCELTLAYCHHVDKEKDCRR